jgi:hypothetical protein
LFHRNEGAISFRQIIQIPIRLRLPPFAWLRRGQHRRRYTAAELT